MIKAIMYHYVRPVDSELPFHRYLTLDNFCRQLDYFESNYTLLKTDPFQETPVQFPDKPSIILTFDDGLRDHYHYVYSELKKRGIPGYFFINFPLNNQLQRVHRIHYLIGHYGGTVILEKLKALGAIDLVQPSYRDQFESHIYTRQENDEATLKTKQLLNYYLTQDQSNTLLDHLMNELANEPKLAEDFYLSDQEIVEMSQNGMIIGNHTTTHPVMSRCDISTQRQELSIAQSKLTDLVADRPYRCYAHPYGHKSSFNDDTITLLDELKMHLAFMVDPREITPEDWSKNRYTLPRYDCNQFPYGQAHHPIDNGLKSS